MYFDTKKAKNTAKFAGGSSQWQHGTLANLDIFATMWLVEKYKKKAELFTENDVRASDV